MLIAGAVQRTGQQVFLLVMRHLVGKGLVIQAGIDLLGQQDKATDTVAVAGEFLRMGEFICMALKVVCPQVLNLVGVLPERTMYSR